MPDIVIRLVTRADLALLHAALQRPLHDARYCGYVPPGGTAGQRLPAPRQALQTLQYVATYCFYMTASHATLSRHGASPGRRCPLLEVAPQLCRGLLQQLSAALGDRHVAGLDDLESAGYGPNPAYRALLALRAGDPVGALVCSPLFSTTRGGAGLYVSDLWVADAVRGSGLGRRLLAQALTGTGAARFIKLAVYDDNPAAQGFYSRLGFTAQPQETNMILHGQALETLKGAT